MNKSLIELVHLAFVEWQKTGFQKKMSDSLSSLLDQIQARNYSPQLRHSAKALVVKQGAPASLMAVAP